MNYILEELFTGNSNFSLLLWLQIRRWRADLQLKMTILMFCWAIIKGFEFELHLISEKSFTTSWQPLKLEDKLMNNLVITFVLISLMNLSLETSK